MSHEDAIGDAIRRQAERGPTQALAATETAVVERLEADSAELEALKARLRAAQVSEATLDRCSVALERIAATLDVLCELALRDARADMGPIEKKDTRDLDTSSTLDHSD